MPKTSSSLTRVERVQLILDLFKIHHYLGKSEIDLGVSAKSGIPADKLKQGIYRDLKMLVDQGRLGVRHILKDGTIVSDSNDNIQEPHKSEWFLPNVSAQFIGSGVLASTGASLFFSDRLAGAFKVIKVGKTGALPKGSINFGMWIGGRSVCLAVSEEALPFRLFIGRLTDLHLKAPTKMLEEIEKSGSLRFLYLHVPNQEISTFKGIGRAGQCALFFKNSETAMVVNLGATNPSLVEILSEIGDQSIQNKRIVESLSSDATLDLGPAAGLGNYRIVKSDPGLKVGIPFNLECPGRLKVAVFKV